MKISRGLLLVSFVLIASLAISSMAFANDGFANNGFAKKLGLCDEPRAGANNSIMEIMAHTMGMERSELTTAGRQGKSLAELAGEKGVAREDLVEAVLAERSEHLSNLVDEGRLTATERENILDTIEAKVEKNIDEKRERGNKGNRGFRGCCQYNSVK